MEGFGRPQPPELEPQLDFYEAVVGSALTKEERGLQYIVRTVDDIDEALRKAEQFPDCAIFDPKKDMIVGYIAGLLCPDGKNLMLWQYFKKLPAKTE